MIDNYLRPLYSHLKTRQPAKTFSWLNFNKTGGQNLSNITTHYD